MTNCGVIGCSPTRPRTPSVPKYFLLTFVPQISPKDICHKVHRKKQQIHFIFIR
jgi:hypothetical protein